MNRYAQALKKENYFGTDEHPPRKNKWASRAAEIKRSCGRRSEEEMRLYECMALSSWECK